MHTFSFEHPIYFLWLIPAFLTLWLITLRSRASIAADQVHQSLFVRCAAVTLLVGAAAGPHVTGPSRDQSVAFVIDASNSISADQRNAEFDWVRAAIAKKPRGDSAAVEEFGSNTSLLVNPSRNPIQLVNHIGVDTGATNIEQAITNASTSIDPEEARQVVILTDGNQTSGSAESGNFKTPVSFVNPDQIFGSNQQPETSITRADLPTIVHENEPTVARVVVESNVVQTVSVSASSAGDNLNKVTRKIGIGKTAIEVPITLHSSGIKQVTFALDAQQDTKGDNNTGTVAVKVIGKPTVLYITDHAGSQVSAIAQSLTSQSIRLEITDPLHAPVDAAGYAGYDGIVVDDAQASELTPEQQLGMQSAVRDYGSGFGMIGGPDSYIGGGWADTSVEEMLPVEMKLPTKILPPPADIVVVLDASGSMGAEEDGVEKVELAARAAVSLLGNLQPTDRVCVLAVTTESVVTVPFSSPEQAMAAKGDIEGLDAGGGGIDCLTGLNAAYEILAPTAAKIKHVIICPDTTDSEEQEHCVERAAEEFKEHHITTSVCGIGQSTDPDVAFQRSVANAGGGQLFVVSRATDLPAFFKRDLTNLTIPPYRNGEFSLASDPNDKVVGGASMGSLPELLGYDITLAKPTATVPIKSAQYHEPIFAYQNYGLGKTFAFTSEQSGSWDKSWAGWQSYTDFWARVIRWSLRSDKPASFNAFADLPSNSATGSLVVDAFDSAGNFYDGANFNANIVGPSGSATPVHLTQTAPGRYEAKFDGGAVGGYLVSIQRQGETNDGVQTLGVARAYSPEFAQMPINRALMNTVIDQTGGKMFNSPEDVWKFRPGSQPERFDLTALFVLLGLLTFLADIAYRLLGLRVRTDRLRAVSGIASKNLTSGIAAFIDRSPQSMITEVKIGGNLSLSTLSPDVMVVLPQVKRMGKKEIADAQADERSILGKRSSIGDEDPFPLVADLDEIRRRERTKNRP